MIYIHETSKIENKLLWFLGYSVSLVIVYYLKRSYISVLYAHFLLVCLFSIVYFGKEFLFILIAPVFVIVTPLNNLFVNKLLKKIQLNKPMHTVVVLAHSDWSTLTAWIKPNYSSSEIKYLIKYLQKKGNDFSFFTQATQRDVHKIMENKNVREVMFYGHGTSHIFQLGTNDILYYCDFNHDMHGKDYVYQFHCGTDHGKSLLDYVVPNENHNKCFLIRKPITGKIIQDELKKRIKNL